MSVTAIILVAVVLLFGFVVLLRLNQKSAMAMIVTSVAAIALACVSLVHHIHKPFVWATYIHDNFPLLLAVIVGISGIKWGLVKRKNHKH